MRARPPTDPVKTRELQALIAGTPCTPELAQQAMQLVRDGADAENVKTDTGDTLLFWLIASDVLLKNVKEIKELVTLYPKLKDAENQLQGWTPVCVVLSMIHHHHGMFHMEDRRVSVNIVEILLSDQNLHKTTGFSNETLMHIACRRGDLAIVQLLYGRGLSLTALAGTEVSQRTALDYAVVSRNFELIEWLLTHADVVGQINFLVEDLYGRGTVLHAAASRGCASIAQLLASKGAGINLTTTMGETVAQLIPNDRVVDFAPRFFVTSEDKCRFIKAHIQNMQLYGEQLRDEGASKGQVIIDLATQLTGKIDAFFALPPETQQANVNTFKEQFIALLNSKNKEMRAYRVNWETIVKNIALALTVIGIPIIFGQLLYSKCKQGRMLFFGQQKQTTSERNVAYIEQSVKKLFSEVRGA